MNAISVTGRPSIHASTLASDFAFQYKSVGQVRVADLVQMEAQRVKIVDGGKLVIPAAMRRELGITTGDTVLDRKSTRLNSSHREKSRMPSSA